VLVKTPKAKIENPFISDNGTIKIAHFEEYIIQEHYKKNQPNDIFIRNIDIDINKINVFLDKKLLSNLSSKRFSKSTLSVFLLVLFKLKRNEDIIILNTNEICEETRYEKSSVNAALNELIDLKVIERIKGRGYKNKYFINPLLIFNGQRIDFIRQKNPKFLKSVSTTKKIF
jgi:hypothetical protein